MAGTVRGYLTMWRHKLSQQEFQISLLLAPPLPPHIQTHPNAYAVMVMVGRLNLAFTINLANRLMKLIGLLVFSV